MPPRPHWCAGSVTGEGFAQHMPQTLSSLFMVVLPDQRATLCAGRAVQQGLAMARGQREGVTPTMKATDDYSAKLDFWARHPRLHPLPPVTFRIPGFTSRKFSSYAEFNAWKREVILQRAERRSGGVPC